MMTMRRPRRGTTLGAMLLATLCCSAAIATEPLKPSEKAAQVDKQIDWSQAKLIVVQDAGRYKALTSFARESMSAMYGAESFPGLSPEASLLDWLFRRDAYQDAPVIYIRDQGLRIDFSTEMTGDQRKRVLGTGRMTPAEFESAAVQRQIDELEPRNTMATAMRRIRDAQVVAESMERLLRIVPSPAGAADAEWYTPMAAVRNLPPTLLGDIGEPKDDQGRPYDGPVPGLDGDRALKVVLIWSKLRAAWIADQPSVAEIQKNLDDLATTLPTLAAAGVYPKESQRLAEAHYYAMGKFTGGWMLYFAGVIISIWALVTRWKIPWVISLVLLLGAMGFHAYGIALRWYILDRIPIANMFEAVIGSAWLGVAVGLAMELIFRWRVFLLASHSLGFLALILGAFVIPGGGTITTIMGILDDVMLRIHTLLIIWSYALIFLAAVIAVVYLIGYYVVRGRAPSAPDLSGMLPIGTGFMGGQPRVSLRAERPLAAGGMPGDEARGDSLPLWLHQMDWCHLIILNLVFVLLFVGTVLGAVWADYSWGRPWGWDPKEVFAMNTWLVYAILIHVRFFAVNKGLCTAWLSVAGCAMMAFNWCFVNFFIVGLHSYA